MASDALTTVHVSTQRRWHGGEQQASLLIEGLKRRGHRAIILARRGGEFERRMAAAGHEVLAFPGRGRNPLALWMMHHKLRELKPQIVHFHDPHGLTGGGLAAWKMRNVGRIASRKVDFAVNSAWRYRRLADRVIVVSNAVAKVCVDSGLAPETLRVVHDGVDPARALSGDAARGRGALNLTPDDKLLLTVANLTDHKGHKYLVGAMPAILAREPRAILALAGDGDLRETLEAQAKELEIGHAVRFLGYRSDVPDLVKAADLFVMPSIMEGLCSTLIDVMFARVPIVTTTAGGIPDLVGPIGADSAVAHLVAPHDSAALAESILAALANRDGQTQLVDRAERRAHERFTADKMVEGTLAVYREVLAGL